MGFNSSKGPSFFDLLTSQADQLVIGVDLLRTLFSAPEDERKALRKRLHEIENTGDELNHQLINKLNQSFITPFDREDLSDLASALDDCMDLFDEAGDLLVLYQVDNIPEPVDGLLSRQIDVLTKCAKLTAENMPKLKRPQDLRDYWVEINRLENDGDKAYRKTLKHLFDTGLDPVTIIKLKDIVEVLEKCTDAFEDLANTVESIAVKES
ncbi:DUF47 domain-containing protein [Actinomycetaceae bacterium WB03_NA08]|uniref:DUF47 domain-containing protein n=1 Tax=Scrofimicrobium canadense TaxID=2652290 RepID=A0A6N7VNH4_9ACTO|nr:DUF47 family protein [Scrofimicrobium canadense]MSS83264.1 DUF47 domain-containing protein [Scrofimicrobium canadense]